MLLVSSGAFAQKMWENKVTNSNMEGEQSEDWSSFWCHEFRDPEVGADQFQGFANIIEDPTTPGNHCAVVVARSEEVARAAENIVEANGALASWDCQFFVYSTEIIPEGKQVRMTLRVRAEHDGYFETQAHWSPGDYNHYLLFGNVNVTTEWQEITVEADVTADHTQSANGKAFQSVAFNLSTDVAGNIFYFDDVKLEVRDPEPLPDPQGYVSLIRNGLQSNDIITFASGQQCTPFTGRDGDYEGDGFDDSGNRINPDVPARIVNDPTDGQPALSMRSVAATFTNEDGQARYTWSNGVDVELTNWQSQFFVSGRHVFKKGEKMKFCIDARADVPTDIETQIHRAPGDYLWYSLFGNLSLTEEWQHFEFEITVDGNQNGGSTVAFNCNVLKDSPTGLKGVEELRFILSALGSVSNGIATTNATGLNNEIQIDLTLARGLNYYTGAIFEVKALDTPMGSISGGGRYDNLTGIFGMPGLSGVGISFGVDRIYDVLDALDLYPKDSLQTSRVPFINFGQKEPAYCLPVVAQIAIDCRVTAPLPDAAKMKKQMAYANAKNIPFVVLAGSGEIEQGKLTLKNMATGEQTLVGPEELIAQLSIR